MTSETSKNYRFLLGNYWNRAKFVVLIGGYRDQQGNRDFFSVTFVTADKEKIKRFLKLTGENFLLFFLLKAIFYIYRFANLSKKSKLCSSWEVVFCVLLSLSEVFLGFCNKCFLFLKKPVSKFFL